MAAADVRRRRSGCYSGWLSKTKSEDAKRKWPSVENMRWFTIDFDNQVLFYAHSRRGKRASQLFCFKDILGAALSLGEQEAPTIRRSLSGTLLRRACLWKDTPAECRFTLHLQERSLRLAADNAVVALWWVDMLNSACMIGLNLKSCAGRSLGRVNPACEYHAAASQLACCGTPSECSHASQSTAEPLLGADTLEVPCLSDIDSQADTNDEGNQREFSSSPEASRDDEPHLKEVPQDEQLIIASTSAFSEDHVEKNEAEVSSIGLERSEELFRCTISEQHGALPLDAGHSTLQQETSCGGFEGDVVPNKGTANIHLDANVSNQGIVESTVELPKRSEEANAHEMIVKSLSKSSKNFLPPTQDEEISFGRDAVASKEFTKTALREPIPTVKYHANVDSDATLNTQRNDDSVGNSGLKLPKDYDAEEAIKSKTIVNSSSDFLAEIPPVAPAVTHNGEASSALTQTTMSQPKLSGKPRKSRSRPLQKMSNEERIAADLALLQRPSNSRRIKEKRMYGIESRG